MVAFRGAGTRPVWSRPCRVSSLCRASSLWLACWLWLACSTPPGTPEATGVAGAYRGSFVIDGQPFAATLTLRSSGGPRVRGVLRLSSPVEVEGEADGVVIDDLLRLTVVYTSPDGCDGRIEGILDVLRDGDALEGPVTVAACEERVAGRFDLRRREG